MATAAPRDLKIGKIIDKTFGVIEHTAVPVVIFLLAVGAMNMATTYFSLESSVTQQGLLGLAKFVATIVTAYVLLDVMLGKTGLRSRDKADVFLAYCGLSILYTLGVMLGFIALIIPGILIMARWSISQPMVVAQGDGVMKALGQSWELTRGHEFSILLAMLALLVVPMAIIITCSAVFDPADLVGMAVSQFTSAVTSVISLAMGVALYGMIVGRPTEVTTTFN